MGILGDVKDSVGDGLHKLGIGVPGRAHFVPLEDAEKEAPRPASSTERETDPADTPLKR